MRALGKDRRHARLACMLVLPMSLLIFLIYSQPRELADARASIDVCGCCQFGHCVQVV